MPERQQNYPDSTGSRWDSGQGGRRGGPPERGQFLDRTEPMSQQDRAANAADSSLDGLLGARDRSPYRASARHGDAEQGTRPVPQVRSEATSWSMERPSAPPESDYAQQNSRVVDPELAAASGVEARAESGPTKPQQVPRPPVQNPPEPMGHAGPARPQSAPPQHVPPQEPPQPPQPAAPQHVSPQEPPQHNPAQFGYPQATPHAEPQSYDAAPGYGIPAHGGGTSTAFDEPTQMHGSVTQQPPSAQQPPMEHTPEPPRRQAPEQVSDGVYRRNRPALGVVMAIVTVAMMAMTIFMLVQSALGDAGMGPSVILSATFALVGLPLAAWGMYPLLGMGANSGPEDFRVLLRPPYAYLLIGLVLVLAAGMAA